MMITFIWIKSLKIYVDLLLIFKGLSLPCKKKMTSTKICSESCNSFVKSTKLSAPLMVVIIKWVSVCLQGTEISRPLFCFAVVADSSGIVSVACLMSSLLCGTIVWLDLVLHAFCLRESSCCLSSAGLWRKDCSFCENGTRSLVSCLHVMELWQPGC